MLSTASTTVSIDKKEVRQPCLRYVMRRRQRVSALSSSSGRVSVVATAARTSTSATTTRRSTRAFSVPWWGRPSKVCSTTARSSSTAEAPLRPLAHRSSSDSRIGALSWERWRWEAWWDWATCSPSDQAPVYVCVPGLLSFYWLFKLFMLKYKHTN